MLLVAIISAVGTALAGLAAVVTALATLGVVSVRRVTENPPTFPDPFRPRIKRFRASLAALYSAVGTKPARSRPPSAMSMP